MARCSQYLTGPRTVDSMRTATQFEGLRNADGEGPFVADPILPPKVQTRDGPIRCLRIT